MCGIFSIIYQEKSKFRYDISLVKQYFDLEKKRGPEFSCFKELSDSVLFGFHRLAINGLNHNSNQPFSNVDENISLICNGEIYNHSFLEQKYGIKTKSQSDCEIILHLYEKAGTHVFQQLDGVFACIIYDRLRNKVCVARDPHGVRPLFVAKYSNGVIAFASDLAPLLFNNENLVNVSQFPPGHYAEYDLLNNEVSIQNYFNVESTLLNSSIENYITNVEQPIEYFMCKCVELLKAAVKKRVYNCQRDIASLLSGGLDSSIISALVARYYHEKTGSKIETYSIGMPGATDFEYSRIMSSHIESTHTEIILTEDDFFTSIPDVIKDIESYDTTTVRASTGNWNVAKYIKENSDAKVIFNGDGADELMGGYLYFHYAPDSNSFHKECIRLLKDISKFDVLRSDKSISSHGLEPRTPFLDKEFTKFYMSIPIKYRDHCNGYQNHKPEKYFLKKAIEIYEPNLLPREVLWRTKEAFSDGVSPITRSWHDVIKEKLLKQNNQVGNVETVEIESQYYKELFISQFGKTCLSIIPYYWLPKFTNETQDASARTLKVYSS